MAPLDPPKTREERLAQALRDNLRRRKAAGETPAKADEPRPEGKSG